MGTGGLDEVEKLLNAFADDVDNLLKELTGQERLDHVIQGCDWPRGPWWPRLGPSFRS